MSDLLDFYQQEAKSKLSDNSWLAELQQQGIEKFARFGFPTRRVEDWKYTQLDALLKEQFTASSPSHTIKPINYDCLEGITQHIISIQNGTVHYDAQLFDQGIIVKPLAIAMDEHPELIKKHLNRVLHLEHAFHALNTAMLQVGVFIYIPAGVKLIAPLVLSHWQDTTNQASHIRHLIIAEKSSEVTIVEDYFGSNEISYFSNTITEIVAEESARVKHIKIQREGKQAYHIGQLSIQQKEKSNVESHSLSIGGKLVRSDTTISLQEPHAHCLLNGVYTPTDGQHVDHHTVVYHNVSHCSSNQDYKGILSGKSRAVFNGKVVVALDAQKTDAKQQNKNVLLSPQAEVNTKPQLEIYADDVVCAHGATVGHLDEDALFYLATRGIEQEEAQKFLIHAFADSNINLFGPFSSWVAMLINEQLG